MKKELIYSEAFGELQQLVAELEDGQIPLEKLSQKVKQANDLIAICETKLKAVEKEIEITSKPKGKKKNTGDV